VHQSRALKEFSILIASNDISLIHHGPKTIIDASQISKKPISFWNLAYDTRASKSEMPRNIISFFVHSTTRFLCANSFHRRLLDARNPLIPAWLLVRILRKSQSHWDFAGEPAG